MRTALATVGQIAAAAVIAVAVSAVALLAIARVEWPAYPSSNQLHALTSVGQIICLAVLFGSGLLWRRGRRWIARVLAALGVSAFSVVTLAMPLGATKLYLFGISVDQQFRTEYLTRLTESPALRDMTYADLPPFYPPGWFWLGGRAAALTGTAGWEMYKPWAITSIAVAAVIALALWSMMVRFEYALIVASATTAVTLAFASPEPYSAVLTVMLPPVLVLAWSGLRGAARNGGQERSDPRNGHSGWAAVVGVGIYLGVTATFYTLLLGYAALCVVVMALLARGIQPLIRLAVAAGIAAAIAAVTWLPYLLRAASSPTSGSGSALHYLPQSGAELPFPMLDVSLLGALCLLGTGWLVARARSSVRAAALTIGVLVAYGWSLLSMLTTLGGTTLLSFRLEPPLIALLAAAGVFGFVEGAHDLAVRWGQRVVPVAAVIGAAGAVAFSQDIPDILRPEIVIAYSDTDGTGERADRRPPGAEKYYAEVDAVIQSATGAPRDHTVVLTADYSFLSYYPYLGFQGLTSHYANPLAMFDERAAAIESWAELESGDEFVATLDELPWQAPTVFLMRHAGPESYSLRLAEDVYPNQPNVRRYSVELKATLFDDPRFTVTEIGPFVLAIRDPSQSG
ncbi:MAG: galactan 5-O-arabinofuranosyltransferase [Mycobacterium sp.]